MEASPSSDLRLAGGALRWCCEALLPSFATTAEVEPITGVVGQDDAIEALRYGLEVYAPGQNIYVRGIAGTGRMTLVRQLLEDISPTCPLAEDRAYVHNFAQPSRPRLISLPRGRGRGFRDGVDRLIEFIEDELAQTLNSDQVRAQRAALDAASQQAMRDLAAPFEKELRAAGLAMATRQVGGVMQPDILPVIDGEPVPLDRLEALESQGKIEAGEVERMHERIAGFAVGFEEINHRIAELRLDHRERLKALLESETRRFLGFHIEAIESEFDLPAVREFLAEIVADLVQRLGALDRIKTATRQYRVNLLLEHEEGSGCPIVIENTPTLRNLLGEIEREFVAEGGLHADHMMIQAGSLLQADGGFLILEARDVLAEPGAWKMLLRSLRAGSIEILPAEFTSPFGAPFLKPDPIPMNVKVVLIGDGGLYEMLSAADPDFGQLFKVLADFETTIARDGTGVRYYAGVISRLARDERLLPFSRDAVVALVDHGARIAGRQDRLTTRFGRLADIAREAAFLAAKARRRAVAGEDVADAIRRGRRRADLPARRFRQRIAEGSIGIRTGGTELGQVNGLAVVSAGPLTYGFPQRITATVGPGSAGVVDIEGEAELSGAIHTKGFHILGGLLRQLLKPRHPLAFSASIAFEQSYGGIDGDSASAAEICCLLSALTGVPLRQDLAMTGAIDQLGHIQPIGAVTEKVEGFFAVCEEAGLSGTQGVIVPQANAGDLMLDAEVAGACESGEFAVYAVETIHEALALFTGMEAGAYDPATGYAEGTLLRLARDRVHEFWRMSRARPEG
ncbi:MAG: ATP-binding protein [Defluviicoccus sp.]|nr:ATP-binding protein [Defluviicoccus sp.]